jgi:hypothetical protein
MAKKKPSGVNGSGFTVEDWARLAELAEEHPVVWSAMQVIKTVFSRAHIESYETINETLGFLNDSLKEISQLPKAERPKLLDNNKEKEFDAILKVVQSIPKINADLINMRNDLFSEDDETGLNNDSLSDTWANDKRKESK